MEIKICPSNSNYGVTADGRVWRLTPSRSPKHKDLALPREIKATLSGAYLTVRLWAGPKDYTARVHTLICEAFNGLRPSKLHEVAHGDCNPLNNVPGNLRWATRAENVKDNLRGGGRFISNAKINFEIAEKIRTLAKTGVSQKTLAKQFGISVTATRRILQHKAWRRERYTESKRDFIWV